MLFVDDGSTDEGQSLVRMSGYPLITSAAGRARQMNTGARATTGEILIFLHADVRLPPDSEGALQLAMRAQPPRTQVDIDPSPANRSTES